MGDKQKVHKKHLCGMLATGEDIGDIAELVAGARFICKSCGRAARKKKNLCKPKSLPKDG